MNASITQIIREKPHLTTPLEFYQKFLKFTQSITTIKFDIGPAQTAYPPDVIDIVFKCFSSLVSMPEGNLAPLKHAMELNEIDFTRVPLGEIPAFSLPYPEDDLAMMLFLLGRPWFLALHDSCPMDERSWDEGKCPLCNSQPAVTWVGEDNRRRARCSFCNTTGYINRTGCAVCRVVDPPNQELLLFEEEKGIAINTCGLCHSYFKTIYRGIISRWSPEIADLVSLPLDLYIQERGFMRRAPNPIGMRKITTRG